MNEYLVAYKEGQEGIKYNNKAKMTRSKIVHVF